MESLMSIQTIKSEIKDFAKDIRLNFGSIFTEEGSPDLSLIQIYGIALASAYTTKNLKLSNAIATEGEILDTVTIDAAKSASSIMAMNNIYYRFLHSISDKEFSKMPAKLRMNVIANSGIRKTDFELMCLAVSAINGCGMCMDSHLNHLVESGVSRQGIQSCIRIASVINATNQAILIAD